MWDGYKDELIMGKIEKIIEYIENSGFQRIISKYMIYGIIFIIILIVQSASD